MYKQLSLNIKIAIIGLTMVASAFAAIALPSIAHADIKDNLCGGASLELGEVDSKTCKDNDECTDEQKDKKGENCHASEQRVNDVIKTIVNILTALVGLLAVVFIIIGGFKYITSGGDSGKLSSARNTIVYALVGLIVVALAQFIVRFVLTKV